LFFENYGQEVGGPIHCWSPTKKLRDQSPPVPTVVAPMLDNVCYATVRRVNIDRHHLGLSRIEYLIESDINRVSADTHN